MHMYSLLRVSCRIVLFCICLTSPIVSNETGCGDANGDDLVNVGDVVYLINYIFREGPSPDPVCIGDANADRLTNVGDATYLINYIFRDGQASDTTCCCPPTVTDIDGNVYQIIQIGDQCWMAENLKVTHYRNGDLIPRVTDADTWGGLTAGAYCEYDNAPANVETYGRLYNWYAIDDSRNIAPDGWHVPIDHDWKKLEIYLGMSQAAADSIGARGTNEGGKLKEAGDNTLGESQYGRDQRKWFYRSARWSPP